MNAWGCFWSVCCSAASQIRDVAAAGRRSGWLRRFGRGAGWWLLRPQQILSFTANYCSRAIITVVSVRPEFSQQTQTRLPLQIQTCVQLAYRCKNFEKITLPFDWLFRSQFGSCVTLDRWNRKHQMTAKNMHVLRQNQRSDKWDV